MAIKIVTIVGARPQFIKAATVSRVIAGLSDVNEVLVHTGQHYDANMSDIFFEQMAIPKPAYNLDVRGRTHGAMTGQQLEKIEEVLVIEKPDWLLVYGDTNSTLSGALAAAKLHIPVAHVEAGLRSFNRQMPEETNRVLTDHVAALLFAPTEAARQNLLAEGIPDKNISVVGDVMFDAALFYKDRAIKPGWYDALGIEECSFVLCTIHRAENTDSPKRLRSIFSGLAESGLTVVLPLHPRTRARITEFGITPAQNVRIIDPVSYLEMAWLEANCRSIATDSGGIQKEAYFCGKPCITLRDETEWVELVEVGCNILVGADAGVIRRALASPPVVQDIEHAIYGDGNAAEAIVTQLASFASVEFQNGADKRWNK